MVLTSRLYVLLFLLPSFLVLVGVSQGSALLFTAYVGVPSLLYNYLDTYSFKWLQRRPGVYGTLIKFRGLIP